MISKLNRVQGGQVARGKTGPEINNRQTTIRKPIESSGSQQWWKGVGGDDGGGSI